MRTVYKYPLVLGITEGPMLAGPIVHVAMQGGQLCAWIEGDPDALVPRRLWVYGTGHPIRSDDHAFVGTALDAPFVWHVYEDCAPAAPVGAEKGEQQ